MEQVNDRLAQAGISTDLATLDHFSRFVAIVRLLRIACPWDREQTHESVKHLLIEEAYETVDAIDEENWPELRKELGDLLLHVVFHAVIAENDDRFTLDEIIDGESGKLVRRHPHVFEKVKASSKQEVLENWERIKVASGEKESLLDGIPRHLPALLQAHRVQEKAAGVGFDFARSEDAWEKVEEELQEFCELDVDQIDERERELGDLLFALVNYARWTGLNPENALRATTKRFMSRFTYIESELKARGKSVHESELEEMDRYWEEAKRKE